MYNILYTPESEENLAEIFWYIQSDSKFYAAKVINSIKSTIDILKMFPFSWKNIDIKNNMIVESTYKYKIIYEIKWNTVYILSIFKYKNSWE
jgi:plasmid stabilization system protein ParE